MMGHDPTRLEMFLTRLAFLLYGKPIYKAFADRLPAASGCWILAAAWGRLRITPRGRCPTDN